LPVDRKQRPAAKDEYYEVFARQDSSVALTHVGSVAAPNDDLAQVRARFTFDEHPWREICLVPAATMIPMNKNPHQRTRVKAV